ncbi:response regulator [Pseudomonas sp. NY15463]|uniref:response regulator n=1 Tax=Pseudomonas sp. NY15463 TaxID=3400361 RepID=UPI003A83E74A
MAVAPPLEERALILAPATLGTQTRRVLTQAGIACRQTCDVHRLGRWLDDGAGLLVIAEPALPTDARSPLHRFIERQPGWSDLPIVLLVTQAAPGANAFGNLLALSAPYADAQLINLALWALRARRGQYQARDLHQQLEAQALAQQAVQQARKLDAIGHLAGGFAHDFNNLLTSIGGSLELIERRLCKGRSDTLASPLQMGRQAVARAALLTRCLLAFSARQTLHSQAVDLGTLLNREYLSRQLAQGITLKLQCDADLWHAYVDHAQLRASLDSLLRNACEAMPSGGVLSIEAHNVRADASTELAQGDYLCLSISDTGQGMSATTLERAFEPFFTTKPVGRGVGLGLSMTYGFCKQSRGRLTMHSQIGKGTVVQVYLPRYRPSTQNSSQATLPKAGDSRAILLVEDDPDVRQLVSQSLEEEGLRCVVACDAEQALEQLQTTQPFGLMITDVGLPGMNGRQLAEIARTLRPTLAVLFITGYAETATERGDFLGPGMQLLSKPFELEQLRERVSQMLTRH